MASLRELKLGPRTSFSPLQTVGQSMQLLVPSVLSTANVRYVEKEALGAVADHEDIQARFPATYGRPRVLLEPSENAAASAAMSVGVILSGGQAPGGHNVIAGIYDFIKKISSASRMVGFLNGPQGLYNGEYCVVDDDMMNSYRNSGGFDMIGSGRHKIEKPEHFKASLDVCVALGLDGIVVIGGDDSNTNAAVLAEYFEANNCRTKVCGAPKTIDGDLKVDPYIPISFGFDTACRTYSELIGNVGQDTLSSQKYYHFIRLMGRAASNIALECALQTRPNVCLISEEVEAKKMTLSEITQQVVDTIVMRSEDMGKNYGVVLLPEGLIEFIPEFNRLISDINDVLAAGTPPNEEAVLKELSYNNRAVFSYLPDNIKQQLLLDRDPHGNVQVAKIETEKLLAQTVAAELDHLASHGTYKGSFSPQFHSYGYEGRSGLPSTFDATYCYALGQNVGALIALGLTGLISSVTNLNAPVSEWVCGGVPITMMCHMEKRHGHMKPVIKKALVELDGEPFACFASQRDSWAKYDLYRSPGPIQFFREEVTVELSITLSLELMKQDSRMAAADLVAAMAIEDAGRRYGQHIHAPLVGAANAIHSQTQRERCIYRPALCPTLFDKKPAFSRCLSTQPTQCMNAFDREALQSLLPHTYGSPLVTIDHPLAEEGSDFTFHAQKKPRLAAGRQSTDAPLNVGILFCGRQAPGGHDIIAGVLDALPEGSTLYGFIGGTEGLFDGHAVIITPELMANYRGQGGFEMLGRSVDRIQSETSYRAVAKYCQDLSLDGLILLGGPRSATDAAYLTEYLLQHTDIHTAVVTVPLTIDGSIKNQFVETTVGFDTASKFTAQIVGNNATDGASAKKYYYFQRLMGQEPSNLALEVALATKPNYTILAEEVEANNITLSGIVNDIADMVEERARRGKNYGSVVIPEGLIESIPELKLLLRELDDVYKDADSSGDKLTKDTVKERLTLWSRALLESLPEYIQVQLMLQRTHANKVQLSQAETERLLAHFVDLELSYRKKKGTYKGTFSVVCSFIGYQARGALPSNFDMTYAYNLGHVATILVANGFTGYMATISNLRAGVHAWRAGGVPISALMTTKSGQGKPSIPNAKIDMGSPSYLAFAEGKAQWCAEDLYENPGPMQFSGPTADDISHSLRLESFDYLTHIQSLYGALQDITTQCRPGCSSTVLKIATSNLTALTDILTMVHETEASHPAVTRR